MVTSPDPRIKIAFPVAYYHCSTLDSADIRRQWYEVVHGLNEVGIKVVSYICDGASEHAKFFDQVLKESAVEDPSITISRDGAYVVSDPPHLIKKFRNNWMSSGQHEKHTKNLITPEGWHIHWSVITQAYELIKTNDDGHSRPLGIIHGFTFCHAHPSSIQVGKADVIY